MKLFICAMNEFTLVALVRQPVRERKTLFLSMCHAILLGSCSFSYGSPHTQSPYIRLKIPQSLANNPLNLSESRKPDTSVSSTFHLEEWPPLPKRNAQNILFLELNALSFYFSKAWVSIMPPSVLSNDSAPLLFLPTVCLINASHTQLCPRKCGSINTDVFCNLVVYHLNISPIRWRCPPSPRRVHHRTPHSRLVTNPHLQPINLGETLNQAYFQAFKRERRRSKPQKFAQKICTLYLHNILMA